MTSRELLEHIKNAPSFKGGDTRYTMVSNSATQYDADIKQIERDLEILEIIKSHIIKKTLIMGSDYDEYNTIQFEVAIKELKPYIQENIKCTPITICNNSFTLIKEWLEEKNNDKRKVL